MTQRYDSSVSIERMEAGLCPECGDAPALHTDDPRFWVPRKCDLLRMGVEDRIASHAARCSAWDPSDRRCVQDAGHGGDHLAIRGTSAWYWNARNS